MTAENVFDIANFFSEKEAERLHKMLSKKVNKIDLIKTKKQTLITKEEAINYLLKNIFSKNN